MPEKPVAEALVTGAVPAATAGSLPLAVLPTLVMLGQDDVGQCADGSCALPTPS